jgi:hypothetical protein
VNISTVLWTLGYFALGYAGYMVTAPIGAYFAWQAVQAGLMMVIGYHTGKAQEPGGVVPPMLRAMRGKS